MQMEKLYKAALLSFFITICIFPCTGLADNYYVAKDKAVPDAGGVYIETVSELYGRSKKNGFKLMEGMKVSNKVICFANSKEIYNYEYIVFEASFAPNAGLDSITLQTANAKNVSSYLREGWNYNRWNNVRIVCSKADENSRHGYATFYINGQAALENAPLTAKFADNMRISFNGAKEKLRLYIGEYSIYFADTDPGAPEIPSLVSGGMKKLLSCLYITKEKAFCNEISFLNAETRIYTDNAFKTQKEGGAAAADGDIAVAETKDGRLYYYEIYYAAKANIFTAADVGFGEGGKQPAYKNCTVEYESGRYKIANLNNISEAELEFTVPNSADYRVMEISADIYPQNISGVQLISSDKKVISPRIYTLNNGIEKNKRNSLIISYDREELKTTFVVNDKIISESYAVPPSNEKENTSLKIVLFGKKGSTAYVENCAVNYILADSAKALPEKFDDLLAETARKNINTEVTLLENFGGMTKDDKLYRVTTQNEAGNVNINWNNIAAFDGYLIIEGNAYIENGSFDVRLNNDKVLNDCTVQNNWIHFMTVINRNTATENVASYIDGRLRDKYSLYIGESKNVRLRLKENSSVVFDDVRMYYTQSAPEVTQLPGVEKSSLLFDKYINGNGKTAADFSSTNVSAKAFTAKAIDKAAENTGNLKAGDYVLIYDKINRVYNGYTVAEYAAAGNTITYKYPSGASVIIAEYDKDNKLVKATRGTVSGGIAAAEHTLQNPENTFKVFTLNSFSDIKPLENAICTERITN